jgi:hypothetical protein
LTEYDVQIRPEAQIQGPSSRCPRSQGRHGCRRRCLSATAVLRPKQAMRRTKGRLHIRAEARTTHPCVAELVRCAVATWNR